MDLDADLDALSREVGQELLSRALKLATAESCTGGWVSQAVTAVAGSSDWFERGFVTYSDLSKQELLDVPAELLARHGAVSEATAQAMADGALTRSRAEVALAVTGIAGPGGATAEKPVGTVCFAWAGRGRRTVAASALFVGNRQEIRRQSVAFSLAGLLRYLRA